MVVYCFNIVSEVVLSKTYHVSTVIFQKLPQELQSALAIKPGQEVIIPTHLHLRRLILPHYLGEDSDFIIEAPLPSSFQWTCQSLGLNPDCDAKNVKCTINCDR